MALVRFEISNRSDYEGGREFDQAGAYERIDGIAHYGVDPDNERNQDIVDLQLCDTDQRGLVHFSGDLTMLVPKDPSRSSRRLFLELPNRGRKTIPSTLHRAGPSLAGTTSIAPGDGFLLRHGYTVAWVGWQWDVYRSDALMGLEAPEARNVSGTTIVRFQPNAPARSKLLADRVHRPLSAADLEDPDAVMMVRDSELGEATIIPREQWQFARDEAGRPVPDPEHMYLSTGFIPGKVYEVTYTTERAPVAGAGLLAVRDVGSFLRFSEAEDNPARGTLDRAYGYGVSQTGRMLRHFVYLGLNLDEEGRQVFDGLLPHVAGARRGEFNHRFAQPSVQATPGFGFLFPHADEPHTHPDSGQVAGMLDRQRELGGVPKIFWTNSSAEYWRGDCAFLHIEMDGSRDLDPAPETRIYSFAGTQHSTGSLPLNDTDTNTGARGRFPFNLLEYSALLRAAVLNLDRWVTGEVDPPASFHPRVDNHNVMTEEQVIEQFPEVHGLYRPDTRYLRKLPRVDIGPDVDKGIGRFPVRTGPAFPAFVYGIDEDGNEQGPVMLPDQTYPVATYTPWNPRHPETGHEEQIIAMRGSTFFFSRTADERRQLDDLRPSLEERYESRDAYLNLIRSAAQKLASQGYILDEDIENCVADAAERFDEAISIGPLAPGVPEAAREAR